MAPISALSTEILSTIFSFVVECDQLAGRTRRRHMYARVCQSWRTAALRNPYLWRDIDVFTPERWIPELLKRSQRANLHVDIDGDAPPERVRVITSHLDRFEDFTIDMDYRSITASVLHESVQALSARELPLLKLRAAGDWPTDDSSSDDSSTDGSATPPVFPTVLDEDFGIIISRSPRLEQLMLRGGINLLWNTPLPSSLIKLCLKNVQRPSLSAFLDVLRQTPHLQHLSLHWCGPKDEAGDPPLTPTHSSVNLPCLQTLELTGVDLATESFFCYLSQPANQVDLHFQNGPAEPTPIPVTRYLSDHIHPPDDDLRWPSIRYLSIKLEGNLAFDLRLSQNPTKATNFNEWKTALPELDTKNVSCEFQWQSNRVVFPRDLLDPFLIHLSHGLPLHNLQILHLDSFNSDSFTSEAFDALIHDLPELVYLEAPGLMRSLWECLAERQKEVATPPTTLLPKLRYVVVQMKGGHYESGDADADARMSAGLNSMKQWLSARLEHTGSKLVRLEFNYLDWHTFIQGTTPGFDMFAHVADVVLFSSDYY